MSSDLVLVSGTTGFLGTAVTLAYLKKGYHVRGTARSQEKADKWEKKHTGQFSQGKLEWAIVKDIAAEGAFDEAIKGVSILAHTASPFHYDVKDNEKDMLIPAIEGTRHALRAAQKESTVKRVVVTSSFAAVLDFNRMSPDVTFSHADWNPATYEEAAKSDNPTYVYCASKKLAEEEAWKIAKEPETKFKLSTVCPPLITGPPQQVIESLDSLNTSSGAVWGVVDADKIPDTSFPVGTDVRDIADLHVLATTTDEGADKRFLTIAFHFDNTQIASLARESFPELKDRVAEAPVSKGSPHFSTDSSLAEKTFGFKWTPFEQSVKDTLAEILKVEKELKQ